MNVPGPGFGIYVHWPFCLSKCPYCDFNSHAADHVDHGRWRAALLAELDYFYGLHPHGVVTSLFFGGGTPSLMDPATVAALIDRVGQRWAMDSQAEITLEANPTSVEQGRFADFRAAGVNRLSLGIQALDDGDLAFLGRHHDARQALDALALAHKTFARFSFDLIYARPGQTMASWQAELTRALSLAGDHLSLYQLTIEDGTAFAPRHARGDFVLPDEDLAADLYQLTAQMTAQAGLPAYEVSNHARPGGESRHNLTYWRGGDYVGVGPGAHGRLGCLATRQHRAADIWLTRVEQDGHATQQHETLPQITRAEEMVMMGLRLDRGLDRAEFLSTAKLTLDSVLDLKGLSEMIDLGLVDQDPCRLWVTPAGRLLLGAVTARLLGA